MTGSRPRSPRSPSTADHPLGSALDRLPTCAEERPLPQLPDDTDDATLVARHLEGDASAFDVLVRRHRDRAWAVAIRTLGDAGEAEDAVQEAFLSAYRKADRFRGDAQFTTWLHRIVVNACLDRMRRRRVRPVAAYDDSVLTTVADPRDAVAERETALDVSEALQRLGDDQRMAIVLVDLQGLSVDEAARVLDVPVGTVKSRCHRGRATLAVHLGHLRPERAASRSPAPGTRAGPGASKD